jgi:hypothetical protein
MSVLHDWLATKPAPEATFYFEEGDMIGCVRGDFRDMAISPAGFGKTREEALRNLEREEQKPHPKPASMNEEAFRNFLEMYRE